MRKSLKKTLVMLCPDNHDCVDGQCIDNSPPPQDDECDQCGDICAGKHWECTTGSCECFDE